jgi:hypothetical protein
MPAKQLFKHEGSQLNNIWIQGERAVNDALYTLINLGNIINGVF